MKTETWICNNNEIICRKYHTTMNKGCNAEILRCGEPDNIPELRVTRESFEKVAKVGQQNKTLPTFKQVMRCCWDIEPMDRPKFKRLVTSLENLRSEFDCDAHP